MRPLPTLMRDWCANGETRIKAWPAVLRASGPISFCGFSKRGTAVLSDVAVRFVSDSDARAKRPSSGAAPKWERRHDAHASALQAYQRDDRSNGNRVQGNQQGSGGGKVSNPAGGRAIGLEEIESIVYGSPGCAEGTDWPPWDGGRVRGKGSATVVLQGQGDRKMRLEVSDVTGSDEGGMLSSLEIAAEIALAVAHASAALGNPILGGPRADPRIQTGCFC